MQEGLEYIFFDYPFGYMQKQISEFISLSIFIDTPLDTAMARRLLRDCKNKSVADIMGEAKWYLEKGRKLFLLSNDFQRKDAELIIDGSLPTDDICNLILERAKML